jgi:hypothetical protein
MRLIADPVPGARGQDGVLRVQSGNIPALRCRPFTMIYPDSPNLIMSRAQATLPCTMPESCRGDVIPAYVEVWCEEGRLRDARYS